MTDLLQIFVGSFALSIMHALIPNHWMPIVAVSNSENWSKSELLWTTALLGLTHTISTIAIGIVVGLIGYKLSSEFLFLTKVISPLILFVLGLIYLILDFRVHHEHKHFDTTLVSKKQKKSKWLITLSLFAAMFFSPCIEIEAYYFTAGRIGWKGIALVSLTYLLITVLGMVLLVLLSRKSIEKLNCHFLEHHEKRLMGLTLIVLAIFSYFVQI